MTSIPATSGIYRIVCTVTGKFYIGSAVNLYHRRVCHLSDLRNGIHGNPKLQNAWNKYGPDTFIFEVLELTLPGIQVEREQYWLDKLKPFDKKGFNINRKANGFLLPPESREKIRLAKLGKKRSPKVVTILRTVNIGRKHGSDVYAGRMKTLIIIEPDGTEHLVHGVKKFCIEHGLDISSLMRVAKGTYKQHNGWTARFPD